MRPVPLRVPLFLSLMLAAGAAPAAARVDVTLDAATLSDLLGAMAPDRVQVALAGGRSVTLQLQDLKVTGFDPGAGANGGVTASLRLKVPELGLDLPVEPRLALEVATAPGGAKTCVLVFRKVVLELPLTGAVDVAPLLPALPVMPDTSWLVRAARGNVRVKPVLVDARTGASALRLGFDLQIAASPD